MLAEIVQVDPIHVYFAPTEAERLEAAHGAAPAERAIPVRLELGDGTPYPHAGAVDYVDPTVDPTRGTVTVRARVPNPEGELRPGAFVRVVAADTDLTPVDMGAYSSRETFMVGNAAVDACRKLKKLVQQAVAEQWEVPASSVWLAAGQVGTWQEAGKRMSAAEAFVCAESRFGTLGSVGWYNTPKDVHGSYRGGTIGASPAG